MAIKDLLNGTAGSAIPASKIAGDIPYTVTTTSVRADTNVEKDLAASLMYIGAREYLNNICGKDVGAKLTHVEVSNCPQYFNKELVLSFKTNCSRAMLQFKVALKPSPEYDSMQNLMSLTTEEILYLKASLTDGE